MLVQCVERLDAPGDEQLQDLDVADGEVHATQAPPGSGTEGRVECADPVAVRIGGEVMSILYFCGRPSADCCADPISDPARCPSSVPAAGQPPALANAPGTTRDPARDEVREASAGSGGAASRTTPAVSACKRRAIWARCLWRTPRPGGLRTRWGLRPGEKN